MDSNTTKPLLRQKIGDLQQYFGFHDARTRAGKEPIAAAYIPIAAAYILSGREYRRFCWTPEIHKWNENAQ